LDQGTEAYSGSSLGGPRRSISFITISLFANISWKMDKLFAGQPGDEIPKSGIQGGDTISEAELVIEEAGYRFPGRGLVCLHGPEV
jgi:hypothetical protein